MAPAGKPVPTAAVTNPGSPTHGSQPTTACDWGGTTTGPVVGVVGMVTEGWVVTEGLPVVAVGPVVAGIVGT
ncbi:MAG TPA: hypothetical protein VGF00_03265, partial [Acidimicrobiia bacterium]